MQHLGPAKAAAAALAVIAIATPTAYGRPIIDHGGAGATHAQLPIPPILPPSVRTAGDSATLGQAQGFSDRRPASGSYSSVDTDAVAGPTRSQSAIARPISAANGGFDYGDAAIGGGVSVGIALMVAGGAVALRRRGQPQHGSVA
jgi:hypothetical protein